MEIIAAANRPSLPDCHGPALALDTMSISAHSAARFRAHDVDPRAVTLTDVPARAASPWLPLSISNAATEQRCPNDKQSVRELTLCEADLSAPTLS